LWKGKNREPSAPWADHSKGRGHCKLLSRKEKGRGGGALSLSNNNKENQKGGLEDDDGKRNGGREKANTVVSSQEKAEKRGQKSRGGDLEKGSGQKKTQNDHLGKAGVGEEYLKRGKKGGRQELSAPKDAEKGSEEN